MSEEEQVEYGEDHSIFKLAASYLPNFLASQNIKKSELYAMKAEVREELAVDFETYVYEEVQRYHRNKMFKDSNLFEHVLLAASFE